MGEAWMTSEIVPRCESCGTRLEDPTTTLCKSCAYSRKKRQQREAALAEATPKPTEPAAPAKAADPEELRDRLRRVEETLRQPPPE